MQIGDLSVHWLVLRTGNVGFDDRTSFVLCQGYHWQAQPILSPTYSIRLFPPIPYSCTVKSCATPLFVWLSISRRLVGRTCPRLSPIRRSSRLVLPRLTPRPRSSPPPRA